MTELALAPRRSLEVRLPRLLAGMAYQDIVSLRDHEQRHGPLPQWGTSGRRRPGRLIDVVDASGLTGRGGGGFPTGRKMRSVASGPGGAVVVANGAEGEPASCKDRLLLTSLVRGRLGYRSWRWVHWLAYACWPIGLAHGLGIGTDRATIWVFALTVGCAAAVAAAATWRLVTAVRVGAR